VPSNSSEPEKIFIPDPKGYQAQQAPDGHPRQCQAKLRKKNGKKCNRWAMTGARFCHLHGGRRSANNNVRIGHLPMWYSKHLSKTIAEAIEESLAVDPSEQLSLYEELAIMRHTATTAVTLYSKAHEVQDPKKRDEAIAAAGALLQEAMRSVASMCEAAGRVESNKKDKFSIHNLHYVVNRIVQISHKVFHDQPDKAKEFERLIRSEVKLADDVSGTSITPDQDVIDMDMTIPKCATRDPL
jgi:hypothetical protein